MPIIIDGNNLLHSLPIHEQSRDVVRRRALDTVRHEGIHLTVVFDGPPPAGSPEIEHLGRVSIQYSGGSSADDVIMRLLPTRGRASEWVVVTDDRALGGRVRERGAQVRKLNEWRSRRRTGVESPIIRHRDQSCRPGKSAIGRHISPLAKTPKVDDHARPELPSKC
jgi:predicted RNA-binding protein with PIN domain